MNKKQEIIDAIRKANPDAIGEQVTENIYKNVVLYPHHLLVALDGKKSIAIAQNGQLLEPTGDNGIRSLSIKLNFTQPLEPQLEGDLVETLYKLLVK